MKKILGLFALTLALATLQAADINVINIKLRNKTDTRIIVSYRGVNVATIPPRSEKYLALRFFNDELITVSDALAIAKRGTEYHSGTWTLVQGDNNRTFDIRVDRDGQTLAFNPIEIE